MVTWLQAIKTVLSDWRIADYCIGRNQDWPRYGKTSFNEYCANGMNVGLRCFRRCSYARPLGK